MKRWDGVYKIISPFTKRQGPDGLIHEGWCAIFEYECCSCRNDRKGRGGRRVRKDDGGAKVEAPPTYKESEDAQADNQRSYQNVR
jgi:hypothetical protein